MTIWRFYSLNAAEGKDDALEAALAILADAVRPTPGCKGVEMVRDSENRRRFYTSYKWDDAEAHKEAGKMLGEEGTERIRTAYAPVLALLDGEPEALYLEHLKSV